MISAHGVNSFRQREPWNRRRRSADRLDPGAAVQKPQDVSTDFLRNLVEADKFWGLLTLFSLFEESVHAPGLPGKLPWSSRRSHRIRSRQSRKDAVKMRDARFSEEVTGRALNAVFPIPDVANPYKRLPRNDSEEPCFALRHRFYREHFGDLAFRTRVRIGMAALVEESRSDKVTRVWRPMFLSYTLSVIPWRKPWWIRFWSSWLAFLSFLAASWSVCFSPREVGGLATIGLHTRFDSLLRVFQKSRPA
jgi:hypothetical protein